MDSDGDEEPWDESKPKYKYEDGLDPERFLEQMETIPAFMTKPPELSATGELPPLVEALQALKYEEEDPDECAVQYKQDGNRNFKLKKYRWAIECYDKALKLPLTQHDLKAALFFNRAAANFQLGNHRRTVNDCAEAVKISPTYSKAILKGAKSLVVLEKLTEALEWIERGLKLDEKSSELLDLKTKVNTAMKKKQRDERIAEKEQKRISALQEAVAQRRIRLVPANPWEGDHVARTPSGTTLRLNEEGRLVWPVRLLFPEHNTQEFVEEVEESTTIADILRIVLEEDPPPWDDKGAYSLQSTQCFFCDSESKSVIYEVDNSLTLEEVLKHPIYFVENCLPTFLVLSYSLKSNFSQNYLSKFETIVEIPD
ncbi:hypothetical protein RvY_19218 [Ramazzottius varieornatus]|uniref:Cns1/TTC4 wheel domain-containing protein n=1 Tax=Ramazzottius varieornatus TaxID=947166 RepID=A0A1D1WC58_RAMVA|nr:hypothetical protein RvY_19218 [Ramazzottius varieornatus]